MVLHTIVSTMWVLLWIFFSLVVGFYGHAKKTKGGFFLAFLLSLIFSPLIGALAVALTPPEESKLLASGMKKCPYCAELVRSEAIVCKHCGKPLETNVPV